MRSLLKSGLRRLARPEPANPSRPSRPRGRKQATVLAVAAQKGGVGKTTTSVNLASAIARFHDRRVLLVDLDPQGHVHTALAEQVRAGGGALSDVLAGDGSLEVMDVAADTHVENLRVTPLDAGLGHTENLIGSKIGKELLLRDALDVTRSWYDLIVLDCPPNLGNLTLNGLVAADQVLIPCDPSPLALTGVTSLVEAIEGASRLNPTIDVLGVVLTRVDGRNKTMNAAMISELEGAFGEALLPTRIGIASGLAKAQHAGVDIFAHDEGSRAAKQYAALADEVAKRLWS